MKKLVIAIDGPAGAGKSTVARIVAEKLGYAYLDTGAMYRAVTWAVSRQGINANNASEITKTAQTINLQMEYGDGRTLVKVDGNDITEAIRSPEISRAVSTIAQIGGVRQAMVILQRQLASRGGVVLDGRDIGSQVLPDADVKVFLTASIEERAKRRWLEMTAKGYKTELAELAKEIAYRDKMDCEREISPLIQAPDAVLIDTTNLTIDGAVTAIIRLCGGNADGL